MSISAEANDLGRADTSIARQVLVLATSDPAQAEQEFSDYRLTKLVLGPVEIHLEWMTAVAR
jgi:hypothetical protein